LLGQFILIGRGFDGGIQDVEPLLFWSAGSSATSELLAATGFVLFDFVESVFVDNTANFLFG
jgi:hypothetical protein